MREGDTVRRTRAPLCLLLLSLAGCQSGPDGPTGLGNAAVGENCLADYITLSDGPGFFIVYDEALDVTSKGGRIETEEHAWIGLWEWRVEAYRLELATPWGKTLKAYWRSDQEDRITINDTVYDLKAGRVFLCPMGKGGGPIQQVNASLDADAEAAAAIRQAAQSDPAIKAFVSGDAGGEAITN